MNALKKLNILALAALACALAACDKGNKETPKTSINQTIQASAVIKEISKTNPKSKSSAAVKSKASPAIKTKVPYQKKDTYFSLPNKNGGDIDLANYANKPVMMIFFAEYCHYCKKAAPFIKKIYDTYSGKGLVILGISVDKNKSTANKFASEHNLNFPIAYNGGELSARYRTRGVPYIFALNKNHEIMDVWAGYDESYNNSIIKTLTEALNQ